MSGTSSTQGLVGQWSPYSSNISTEAAQAFEEAFKGFVGVSYQPVAFATQVVSGIEYRFFCNAKALVPVASNEAAIVDIFKPLGGENAKITKITSV